MLFTVQEKITSVGSKIQTSVIHSLSLDKTQPRPSHKSVTDNAIVQGQHPISPSVPVAHIIQKSL